MPPRFARLLPVTTVLVAVLGCSASPAPDPPMRMDTYWNLARRELRPWMNDEERAVALAAWIARSGTNDRRREVPDGVPFLSLCGYRSTVFLQLGARAGLVVRRVALDDFAGSGHAAVEVHYDRAWHFLDVTYAGYFRVDGRILSFDEIQARPEWAVSGLVVLDGSIDRWGDGTPVDNAQRMRRNYTPENVRAARRLKLFEPRAPRSGAES